MQFDIPECEGRLFAEIGITLVLGLCIVPVHLLLFTLRILD